MTIGRELLIKFLHVRYHRNGCMGAGFYAVRMQWDYRNGEGPSLGTAIVFEADEHIAVVADGEHGPDVMTCWRYEDFAKHVRAYVASPVAQKLAFAPC